MRTISVIWYNDSNVQPNRVVSSLFNLVLFLKPDKATKNFFCFATAREETLVLMSMPEVEVGFWSSSKVLDECSMSQLIVAVFHLWIHQYLLTNISIYLNNIWEILVFTKIFLFEWLKGNITPNLPVFFYSVYFPLDCCLSRIDHYQLLCDTK